MEINPVLFGFHFWRFSSTTSRATYAMVTLGMGEASPIEGIPMELSSHIATENPSFIGDCFVNTSIWFLSIYRRSILTGMVMVIFWLIQILMVISWELHRNIVVVFHRLSSRSYPQNACLQELEQTPLSYIYIYISHLISFNHMHICKWHVWRTNLGYRAYLIFRQNPIYNTHAFVLFYIHICI